MNSDPRALGRAVGRYEIVRQIGQGAMGTVYLARQLDLDRDVALKELGRIGSAESAVFASRFVREARLAGSLSHANIVTVYEYFEHDGRPYIAMEHAEGGSLREHIDGLSPSQIVGVLEGLLAALTHAEARGIVHRDIKPENILVTADGRIKIADFGIAKAYSLVGGTMLTATGTTVGTPMYMAPEQAMGKPLSIATDLYAVGIVAFEMLFGYVPFGSGDSPLAIVLQHINEPVPEMRALRPDLDPRLCSWLEQLLAKEAADRPSSATAALDALEEIALELLGNRWRREAPLMASAAAAAPVSQVRQASYVSYVPQVPQVRPVSQVPPLESPAPVREPSIEGHDQARPAGADATRDAGSSTIAPRELREQTEHYGRPQRDPPQDDAPAREPGARWSLNTLALIIAATVVAAGGGYLAFHEDTPSPRPVNPQTVKADIAASKRFAVGLSRAFERLNKTRVIERERLAAAKTARQQGRRAQTVASAYSVAAGAVNQLEPSADQRDEVLLLSDKLGRASQAYVQLAAAATARRAKAYEDKRSLVARREEAVRRAARLIR